MSTTHPSDPGSRADAVPTPSGGIPLAPRGRRRDHALVAVVGAVLAPALLALSGMAASWSLQGRWAQALGAVAVLLVVSGAAQTLFATRSSLGGLVTGLVALTAQVVILMSPDGADQAPFAWARTLIPTGMVLLLAGLMLGGAWAMRRARRAGRAQARHAQSQAQADRTLGVTPSAPPARRRDHVLSLPAVAVGVVGAFYLLRGQYSRIVTGSSSLPTVQGYGILVCALVLLVVGAAWAGRSTLGARGVGPLLTLAGLPLLLSGLGSLPGRGVVAAWVPADATGISLVSTGVVLTTIGWGVHMARRQGRVSQARRHRGEAAAAL